MMKSHEETLDALSFVLLAKIYPNKPSLMRNDTLAASLIVQYVDIMLAEYKSSRRLNQNTTRFQREARSAFYIISPLESLTQETVRKYIAQLWKSGAFVGHIEFREVKGFW